MKSRELLDKALIKVGGPSELARQIRWNKGSIAGITKKDSKQKVPPYRAAQLADLLGVDRVAAYLGALEEHAKTEHEKAFWREQIEERKKKLKFA